VDEPVLRVVGQVESPLVDPTAAPKQGDEGGATAVLRFDPSVAAGLRDLRVGDDVLVLTWLDRADRTALVVHPRDDPAATPLGVFSTRSADRPNPIGIHRVAVLAVDGPAVTVAPLEAVDGTPVLDVKPVLGPGDR
jgi:tRNA-Thr(GGU) m(6)t(6)A37 methyltransferase TsaA